MNKLLLALLIGAAGLIQSGFTKNLTDEEIVAADRTVTQFYNQLMPLLNQQGQQMLMNDQQKWYQYRDQLVRENPDNQGGVIYQSSIQRAAYLQSVIQQVRQQVQKQATAQRAPTSQKKTDDPKGQIIKVPQLPSDIANCVLNPETKVWEKQSEKGQSSVWHTLVATNSTNPVQVDIRTQYTGYLVGSEYKNNWIEHKIYEFNQRQWLWNSHQYQVARDDITGLTLASSIPLEEKNLQSITEYPVSVEFKISNTGLSPIRIKQLNLFVKDYQPINKTIPFFIKDFHRNWFSVANLGWLPIEKIKCKLTQVAGKDQFPTLSSGQYVSLDQGMTNITADYTPKSDILSFIKSKDGLAVLRTTDDFCHSLFLKADMDIYCQDGSTTNTTQYYTIFGENSSGQILTTLAGDVKIPDRKLGYRIKYDIDDEIPLKASKTFHISLFSEKSCNIKLVPEIRFNEDSIKGRELSVKFEKIKQNSEVEPYTAVFKGGGGDTVPLRDYQKDVLYSTFPELGKSNSLRNKLESDSIAQKRHEPEKKLVINSLGLFFNDLIRLAQSINLSKNLLPSLAKNSIPKIYRKIDGNIICETSISGTSRTAVFTVINENYTKRGHVDIVDDTSKTILFRAPWTPPSDFSKESSSIEVVASEKGKWIAWTIKYQGSTKLYLLFPDKSETTFTIPLFDENTITGLSRNNKNDNIVINTLTNCYEINPYSELFNSLIAMFKVDEVIADNYDDKLDAKRGLDFDELGRVQLYIPCAPSNFNCSNELSNKTEIKLLKESPAEPVENVEVNWFKQFLIGVKKSRWEIWDLKSGVVRAADASESEYLNQKTIRDKECVMNTPKGMHYEKGIDLKYDNQNNINISVNPPFKAHMLEDKQIVIEKHHNTFNPDDTNYLLRIPYCQSGKDYSQDPSFSKSFSLSPSKDKIVFSNHDGTILYLVDLEKFSYLGRVVQSSSDPSVITTVFNNGYYLSGNGKADDVVFSDGLNGYNISQFEVIYNRPDIILEQLGADQSIVEQAKKLRARQASRSDFKSLDKASLIDIPVVTLRGTLPKSTEQRAISIDYQAENNTGPLRELKIYNNGALVSTRKLYGREGSPSMDASGSETIQLASGDNLIQLCAINDDGVSSTFNTTKVTCTAPPVSRQCFITTVGISQYKDTNYTLQYAAKDAGDMASALADAAKHRGLDPKVLVIKNDEANLAFAERIKSFLSSASIDDEVVLFFAGHGLLDKDLVYHYPTYETDFNSTVSNGIPFNELESLVEGIKPLKRTIFFDTCHSGEVEEDKKAQLQAEILKSQATPSSATPEEKSVNVHGIASRGMRIAGVEQPVSHSDFVELEKLFPDSRRAKGANLLTSSSGSEFSMESDEWKNGLFTYCFLKALKEPDTDKNHDGKITFNELAESVKDRVSKLSCGKQRPITRGVNREAETVIAVNNLPAPQKTDNTLIDSKKTAAEKTEHPIASAPLSSSSVDATPLSTLQNTLDQAKRDLAQAYAEQAKALKDQQDYMRSQASAGGVKNFYQFSAASQQMQDASAKIEEKTAAVKAAEEAIQKWKASSDLDVKASPEKVRVQSSPHPTSSVSGSSSTSSDQSSNMVDYRDTNTSTKSSADLQTAVDQAKRDLDEALSEQSKAQKDFSNAQLISAGGIGKPAEQVFSEQRYQNALSNVAMKTATLKAAQAALDKQSSLTSAANPSAPSDKTDASIKAINDLQKLHDDLEKISKSLNAKKN